MTIHEKYKRNLLKYKDHTTALNRAINQEVNNYYKKKSRIYKRIKEIIKDGKGYFITLTIKGETPPEKTFLNRCKRWSKENCILYYGNLDYGGKNNRLHAHVACIPRRSLHETWKYGAINIVQIKINDNSTHKKIGMYISKMTNHAIKNTASNTFYSKNIERSK